MSSTAINTGSCSADGSTTGPTLTCTRASRNWTNLDMSHTPRPYTSGVIMSSWWICHCPPGLHCTPGVALNTTDGRCMGYGRCGQQEV